MYLLSALTDKSKDDIKKYGKPITKQEMLYALRQHGFMEFTNGDIPKFKLDQLELTHQETIKYVMFYRYYKNQRSQIKNLMTEHKIFYESDDWIVYDLSINS